MKERWVAFKIGVDRAHFKSYGDFSLEFGIVYYVGTPDYNFYMDMQQSINLEIHEQFEKEHFEFAYPTQTVFMRQSAQKLPVTCSDH